MWGGGGGGSPLPNSVGGGGGLVLGGGGRRGRKAAGVPEGPVVVGGGGEVGCAAPVNVLLWGAVRLCLEDEELCSGWRADRAVLLGRFTGNGGGRDLSVGQAAGRLCGYRVCKRIHVDAPHTDTHRHTRADTDTAGGDTDTPLATGPQHHCPHHHCAQPACGQHLSSLHNHTRMHPGVARASHISAASSPPIREATQPQPCTCPSDTLCLPCPPLPYSSPNHPPPAQVPSGQFA